MNTDWHDLIQRHIAGTVTDEEAEALQQALRQDTGLLDLYLSYINLDIALEEAAEAPATSEHRHRIVPLPSQDRRGWHRWLSLAAAAACVAGLLVAYFKSARPGPDLAATLSSAQQTIAQLSIKPAPVFPEWMSPTASMLDQPSIPK